MARSINEIDAEIAAIKKRMHEIFIENEELDPVEMEPDERRRELLIDDNEYKQLHTQLTALEKEKHQIITTEKNQKENANNMARTGQEVIDELEDVTKKMKAAKGAEYDRLKEREQALQKEVGALIDKSLRAEEAEKATKEKAAPVEINQDARKKEIEEQIEILKNARKQKTTIYGSTMRMMGFDKGSTIADIDQAIEKLSIEYGQLFKAKAQEQQQEQPAPAPKDPTIEKENLTMRVGKDGTIYREPKAPIIEDFSMPTEEKKAPASAPAPKKEEVKMTRMQEIEARLAELGSLSVQQQRMIDNMYNAGNPMGARAYEKNNKKTVAEMQALEAEKGKIIDAAKGPKPVEMQQIEAEIANLKQSQQQMMTNIGMGGTGVMYGAGSKNTETAKRIAYLDKELKKWQKYWDNVKPQEQSTQPLRIGYEKPPEQLRIEQEKKSEPLRIGQEPKPLRLEHDPSLDKERFAKEKEQQQGKKTPTLEEIYSQENMTTVVGGTGYSYDDRGNIIKNDSKGKDQPKPTKAPAPKAQQQGPLPYGQSVIYGYAQAGNEQDPIINGQAQTRIPNPDYPQGAPGVSEARRPQQPTQRVPQQPAPKAPVTKSARERVADATSQVHAYRDDFSDGPPPIINGKQQTRIPNPDYPQGAPGVSEARRPQQPTGPARVPSARQPEPMQAAPSQNIGEERPYEFLCLDPNDRELKREQRQAPDFEAFIRKTKSNLAIEYVHAEAFMKMKKLQNPEYPLDPSLAASLGNYMGTIYAVHCMLDAGSINRVEDINFYLEAIKQAARDYAVLDPEDGKRLSEKTAEQKRADLGRANFVSRDGSKKFYKSLAEKGQISPARANEYYSTKDSSAREYMENESEMSDILENYCTERMHSKNKVIAQEGGIDVTAISRDLTHSLQQRCLDRDRDNVISWENIRMKGGETFAEQVRAASHATQQPQNVQGTATASTQQPAAPVQDGPWNYDKKGTRITPRTTSQTTPTPVQPTTKETPAQQRTASTTTQTNNAQSTTKGGVGDFDMAEAAQDKEIEEAKKKQATQKGTSTEGAVLSPEEKKNRQSFAEGWGKAGEKFGATVVGGITGVAGAVVDSFAETGMDIARAVWEKGWGAAGWLADKSKEVAALGVAGMAGYGAGGYVAAGAAAATVGTAGILGAAALGGVAAGAATYYGVKKAGEFANYMSGKDAKAAAAEAEAKAVLSNAKREDVKFSNDEDKDMGM